MQKFWLRRARWVAARVNGARWLGFTLPALAVGSFASGCALLVFRRNGWDLIPLSEISILGGLAVTIAGWFRARRSWFTVSDALVRLDAVLVLHNRLTSAAVGVGEWPAEQHPTDDRFRWRFQQMAVPLILAVGFVSAALWVPVRRDEIGSPAKLESPIAWSQVDASLAELRPLISQETVEATEKKLDVLRQQTPETWYSQSSLEASDALRQETGNSIAALQRNLDAASHLLNQQTRDPSVPTESGGSSAPSPGDAQKNWKEAMRGLETGALSLNKPDLAALKQFDPKNSRTLSPEQLKSLQNKLSQGSCSCGKALGKLGEALAKAKEKQAKDREATGGPGGKGGGTMSANLSLNSAPTPLSPGQSQEINSADTEHAAIGDLMKVVSGEHKVDPAAGSAGQAGGSVATVGAGGEAVWKSDLPPAERAILRQYFK